MTQQTQLLCKSLPNFATMFQQSDGRGTSKWHIIRWENISPEEVKPEQVEILADLYSNRTQALRTSAIIARQNKSLGYKISEKDHWGVWKWEENGTIHYQSVMPELSELVQGEKGELSSEPEKVSSGNTMVRIGEEAHRLLRGFAQEDGKSMQAVLEDAVREYDRSRYFAKADAAYRALRSDSQSWNEELEERSVWENTLMDNQNAGERWHEDGTVTHPLIGERKRA